MDIDINVPDEVDEKMTLILKKMKKNLRVICLDIFVFQKAWKNGIIQTKL